MSSPIIIIGAGVSGLAFAQGLSKLNIPFEVCERDSSLAARAQGYRFRLSDHGIDALEQNLTEDHFDRIKQCCRAMVNTTSNTPTTIDAKTAEPAESIVTPSNVPSAITTRPPWSVDRSALRAVLMEGIEDHVHFGKAFESYHETEEGVVVKYADGSQSQGLALIGADGTWSKVRQQLLPDYRLLDTEGRLIFGKTNLTEELEAALSPTASQTMVMVRNPGAPILLEVMRFSKSTDKAPDDYVYWVMFFRSDSQHMAASSSSLSSKKTIAFAQTMTRDLHPSLRYIFKQANDRQAALYRVVSARPPISALATAKSRVSLLGDAIHAMSPTAALGATTALRDTGVLIRLIRQKGVHSIIECLRQYETEMREYASDAITKTLMGGKVMFGMRHFDELPEVESRM